MPNPAARSHAESRAAPRGAGQLEGAPCRRHLALRALLLRASWILQFPVSDALLAEARGGGRRGRGAAAALHTGGRQPSFSVAVQKGGLAS